MPGVISCRQLHRLSKIINYIHVISLKVALRALNFAPGKISAALSLAMTVV